MIDNPDRIRPNLRLLAIAVAGVTALTTQDAAACRVWKNPDEIAGSERYSPAIVEVTAAHPYGAAIEWQPWRAQGRTLWRAPGQPAVATFEFGNAGSSAACDGRQDVPKPGDLWVIYTFRSEDGMVLPVRSYPLDLMRPLDPRVRGFRR